MGLYPLTRIASQSDLSPQAAGESHMKVVPALWPLASNLCRRQPRGVRPPIPVCSRSDSAVSGRATCTKAGQAADGTREFPYAIALLQTGRISNGAVSKK